jgi:hypothetical protein
MLEARLRGRGRGVKQRLQFVEVDLFGDVVQNQHP